jgi:hypothetical protein
MAIPGLRETRIKCLSNMNRAELIPWTSARFDLTDPTNFTSVNARLSELNGGGELEQTART